MSERSLQLDALRDICSPEKIASLFRMLGYNADAQPLEVITQFPRTAHSDRASTAAL